MALLDELSDDADDRPPFIVIYGVDGIGKTTLATEAPDAVYLHTRGENPPSDVKIPKAEITDYVKLKDFLLDLIEEPHDFKNVIMDSVDGIEPMVWDETCYIENKPNIEAFGFGRGYVAADDQWNEIIKLIMELKDLGIGVILLAHPSIERFDSPISEPYNRYTIKIHKRANAMIREEADIVAFMNHRVKVENVEISRGKSVSHAEGKARDIYLTGTPAYDAKNRYSMPDSIQYKKGKGWDALSKFFPAATGKRRNK